MDETNNPVIDEGLAEKKELKKFQVSYLLFFLATIFLAVSQISLATNINGVPQILVLLYIFKYVSYVIYFIAAFRLRKVNKSYFYALWAFGIFLLLTYIADLCSFSSRPPDQYIGKALGWSSSFVECMFYLYFFNATRLFFDKNGFASHAKAVRISLGIFGVIFLITEAFIYFSTTRMVRVNRFTNRFFLYGSWAMQFIMYAFIVVLVVLTFFYVRKQIKQKQKEGGSNNG